VLLFDQSTDALISVDAGIGAGAGDLMTARATASGSAVPVITNLAETSAAEAVGISIGAQASQKPFMGDPFTQTATGAQQAASYDGALAYNDFATQEEGGALLAYGEVATGTL